MENQMLYVHSTNVNLARTLDVIDPFITGKQREEESAILAGFETEFEQVTR